MEATADESVDYLILEDNADVARAIDSYLSRHGTTLTVFDADAALHVLDSNPPRRGFISDVNLSDGIGGSDVCGLAAMAYARLHCPWLNGLIVTGFADNLVQRLASDLAVAVLEKPFGRAEIDEFVNDEHVPGLTAEAEAFANSIVKQAARELNRNSVTPRQGEVVDHLIEGYDPAGCRKALGITKNTYYNHTKAIFNTGGANDMNHFLRLATERATLVLAEEVIRLREWLGRLRPTKQPEILRPLKRRKPRARASRDEGPTSDSRAS